MFVCFLFVFCFLFILLGQPGGHLLGKSSPLGFLLVLIYLMPSFKIVCVPFPFGVLGRMWNSTVLVPEHCLFVYSTLFAQTCLFEKLRITTI